MATTSDPKPVSTCANVADATDPRPRVDVVCRPASNPFEALGSAVELMFQRLPFANFKFGQVIWMLRGQIKRGHYLIAYRGTQPVGYSGWAECSERVGEAWLHEGYSPSYDECASGDCAMLITVVSTERATTIALIRAMRQRYPNRRVYFKREYGDGKTRKKFAFNRATGD